MDPIPCVSTTTQGKPLDLAALEQEIGGQGKNASYDRSTGQVVEGRVGVTFDVAGAEKLVEDAQPGQEIVIPAQITYPTVTKAELEKVLFRDVLGQYTSYVSVKLSFSSLKTSSMSWFFNRRLIQVPAVSRLIYPAATVATYNKVRSATGKRAVSKSSLPKKSSIPAIR